MLQSAPRNREETSNAASAAFHRTGVRRCRRVQPRIDSTGSTRIRDEKNGQLPTSTGCSVHCQRGEEAAPILGLLTTMPACASFRATDSLFPSPTGGPSGPSLLGGKEGQGREALQRHSGSGTRQGLNSNIVPRERVIYRALALPGDPNRLAVNGLGSSITSAHWEAACIAMRVLSALGPQKHQPASK